MENKDFLTLIERIESLKGSIQSCLDSVSPKSEPYRSDMVDELYAALAEAQPNLISVASNKTNKWFDSQYATIFQIGSVIYPVLGPCGLSITQQTRVTSDGGTVLHTLLCHKSGQWMEMRVRVIPPKNDIDSFKSTYNALRSTALLSILGLGVQDDPLDDDGEIAMIEARASFAKAPTVKDIKAKQQDSEVITKEQREEIEYEMGEYTELAEEIMNRCHVRSLSDIPKSQFRNAISFIRKNKLAREGKNT